VINTDEFENISYNDADRIAILENKAAELERLLLAATGPEGLPSWVNVATPGDPGAGHRFAGRLPEYDVCAGGPDDGLDGEGPDDGFDEGGPDDGLDDQDIWARGSRGRTEALINRGRPRARRSRGRRVLAHWRLIAAGAVALLAGVTAALVTTGGTGGSWPASVATVRAEIKQACANPNVAAEPSGLNFACASGTKQVLWVFALLTSGGNPGYVDQSTGRKGLEPIQPAQGGDIAWSLNLHHPYDPANPVDSLAVAARAINNIIGGATLTSANGTPSVQPGLESSGANCRRYTGSATLVTRSGYPARCASPVSAGSGAAALVSDVFRQWMGGAPSQVAREAGVLFENVGNPGNPQVQAILGSLPASGG
jgi:hypothetical protein